MGVGRNSEVMIEGNKMSLLINKIVPNTQKLWRFVATGGAWLQALDYTSFDYTQDRIDRLERKVVELTEELRQSRASSPRDSAPQ